MAGKYMYILFLLQVSVFYAVDAQTANTPDGFALQQTNAFGPRVGGVGTSLGITDERECLNACRQRGTCAAVDFDRTATPQTCTELNQQTVCTANTAGTAVTVYTKFPCGFDQRSRNVHVQGGQRVQSPTGGPLSLVNCLQICLSSLQCLSVDYNQDGTCWIHGPQTACNELVKKRNCDHYVRINACQATTTPPTGFATVNLNQNIPGGTLQREIHDPRKCTLYCRLDVNCLAYDFNRADRTCFFHYLSTACNARSTVQGVSHVSKCTSCNGNQCVQASATTTTTATTTTATTTVPPVMVPQAVGMGVSQGFQIIGGILQPLFRTFETCRSMCLSQSIESCSGLDYNFDQQACFFHTNGTICNALRPATATTFNFRRVSCGTQGGDDMMSQIVEVNLGQHIIGAVPVAGRVEIRTCKVLCFRQSEDACAAFDYDYATRTCWIHSNLTACGPKIRKPTCDNYRRKMCNDMSTTTPTSQSNVSSTTASTTTMSMVPAFPAGIIQASKDRHINGGSLIEGVTDANTCVERCVALPTSLCKAVDFDSRTHKCYFHTPRTACNKLLFKANVVNYRRTRCTTVYKHTVHQTPHKRPHKQPVYHMPVMPVYVHHHRTVSHVPVQKTYVERIHKEVPPPPPYHPAPAVPAVAPVAPAVAPAAPIHHTVNRPQQTQTRIEAAPRTSGGCPPCQSAGQYSPGPNRSQFCVCGAGLLSHVRNCAPGTEWCQRILTCAHIGSCNGA